MTFSVGGEVEVRVGCDGGDYEGDEADVHGVECPADAGGDEEFAVRLVEGQPVEALVAGELRGLR